MPEHSGLLTDLYELTMAAGYLQTGFDARATFELFVRHLPPHRNYLVAAGLEQGLEFLENVRFSSKEIDYLRHHPVFRHIRDEFYDYLSTFRFTGDVWAMPEGSLVFPGEPMLRIVAPIIEGQIMETYLLSTLSYQTMIASKAARVVTAAQGRQIVDFGARRAHGSQASLLAARAASIGGCEGTSNVLAGQQFGMTTYGTQAHSWVMAHEDEAVAFAKFLDAFPDAAVLLLDTYDVRSAIKKIIAMKRKPAGVRLDSGDLAKDSRWVRRELERAGEARGAAKLTEAKVTYPGRKQVFRYSTPKGEYLRDKIALDDEPAAGGEPLLIEVMRGGKRTVPQVPVSDSRALCLANLARLPQKYRQINRTAEYPVIYTTDLESMLEKVRKRVRGSATRQSHGD